MNLYKYEQMDRAFILLSQLSELIEHPDGSQPFRECLHIAIVHLGKAYQIAGAEWHESAESPHNAT
jgi:hypothetical protein